MSKNKLTLQNLVCQSSVFHDLAAVQVTVNFTACSEIQNLDFSLKQNTFNLPEKVKSCN